MRNYLVSAQSCLEEIERSLGCSAFAQDGHGSQSLHYAAASFSKDVVRFFLARCADPDALNGDGLTPLQELERWKKKTKSGEKWTGDPDGTAALLRSAPKARSSSLSSSNSAPAVVATGACESSGSKAESSNVDVSTNSQEDSLTNVVNDLFTDEHNVKGTILMSFQRAILVDQVKSCKDMWRLDPSQHKEAEKIWAHRVEEVAVSQLLNTHSDVAGTFKNGKHQGKPILSLLKELEEGVTRPVDLPYLVAAKQWGKLFVIFGNRRLAMLKRYAESVGVPIRMNVIVHEMPNPGISPPELQTAFLAKFVLATTTEDGNQAPIRQRWHRGGGGGGMGSPAWRQPAAGARVRPPQAAPEGSQTRRYPASPGPRARPLLPGAVRPPLVAPTRLHLRPPIGARPGLDMSWHQKFRERSSNG